MNFPMRGYDEAMSRLEAISRFVKGDAFLKVKITIEGADRNLSTAPPSEVTAPLERAIRASLPAYAERLLADAREEVRKAAEQLRGAIESDLNSNIMREPKGD